MTPQADTQITPVREVQQYHPGRRDPGIAVALELIPGIAMQTFGIGNIYAGNVAIGVLMMIGYWVSVVINVILCAIVVGFITLPLTWIAFMIFCPIAANHAAKRSWVR